MADERPVRALVHWLGQLRRRGRQDLEGLLPKAGIFAARVRVRPKGLDLYGYARLRSAVSFGQRQVPILASSGT